MADWVPGAPIPHEVGAAPLAETVNCVYGSTATKLTRPAGAKVLVLVSRKGSWNVRVGDRVSAGMPSAFLAGAPVADGSAAVPVLEGGKLVIYAHNEITVKAYASDSELVYWYL